MSLNAETIPTELTVVDMGIGDSTGNQTGIDIKDFLGKIAVAVNISASTGTIALQESDAAGSGYAAFDPALTASEGLTVLEVDTRKTKRYIRAVAGGTMNGEFSVVAVGKKQVTA